MSNLKCLSFITKWNSSALSPSVPHNSSRLFVMWSFPAQHRRLMKAFISVLCESLASVLLLKLGWIRIYWCVCWILLSEISCNETVPWFKGHSGLPAWPITPGNFLRIFCHLRRMCVELLRKTVRFGGPEFSYRQTYSAGDWLSNLRTSYSTQNLQRKHRTDLHMTTKARKRTVNTGLMKIGVWNVRGLYGKEKLLQE